MAKLEEGYCRLCAEPTPNEQLIFSTDDVATTSKIITKMLWININVSTNNPLPTTICFSCFDLLERTWSFLHNVRTAQEKLASIFVKNSGSAKGSEKDNSDCENVGKPLDISWEEFQNPKKEIKAEEETSEVEVVGAVDPNNLLGIDFNIKTEDNSDVEIHGSIIETDGFSSDSDLPLQLTLKKKKTKKKKKKRKHPELMEAEALPLGMPLSLSWEEYMCRCAQCDAQCKNVVSLRLHSLQIHNCCCSYKCSDCGKVLTSYKSFVSHVRLHKKLLKYYCEYCNKQFTTSTFVKEHIASDHAEINTKMCRTCGALFESTELLQDHLEIYSKSNKRFSKKYENSEITLKCELCDKEFKSRGNLQQHKQVHTERTRNFSCHVCGKMFFTKGTLGTHMATHEEAKPFKCEYCPMAFRARGNLQSHISMHSGAKPFVCEQCGKSFRVKRHLKSHSIIHTDLMPYVCPYCNKQFRFKTRLNLHLRQHTGARPYECIYCQRNFTNGSNYKKHMKRRHNIDTSKKKIEIVNTEAIIHKIEIPDDVSSREPKS